MSKREIPIGVAMGAALISQTGPCGLGDGVCPINNGELWNRGHCRLGNCPRRIAADKEPPARHVSNPGDTCPDVRACVVTLWEFLGGSTCGINNCPRKLVGLPNGGIRGDSY